jgi:hypothetical protein
MVRSSFPAAPASRELVRALRAAWEADPTDLRAAVRLVIAALPHQDEATLATVGTVTLARLQEIPVLQREWVAVGMLLAAAGCADRPLTVAWHDGPTTVRASAIDLGWLTSDAEFNTLAKLLCSERFVHLSFTSGAKPDRHGQLAQFVLTRDDGPPVAGNRAARRASRRRRA